MEISVLKSQIRENKLDNFYIFTGEEWAVQRIYIDKMASSKGLEIKYIDSIKDIYSKLVNKGFLNKSYCYVIRDDADIMTESKLQEQLLNNLVGDNLLILLLTKIDKRSKMFKAFEDKYINFDKMPVETLKKHVKKEINLDDKHCEKLMEICDFDYGKILLEINKIKNYVNYLETHTL